MESLVSLIWQARSSLPATDWISVGLGSMISYLIARNQPGSRIPECKWVLSSLEKSSGEDSKFIHDTLSGGAAFRRWGFGVLGSQHLKPLSGTVCGWPCWQGGSNGTFGVMHHGVALRQLSSRSPSGSVRVGCCSDLWRTRGRGSLFRRDYSPEH